MTKLLQTFADMNISMSVLILASFALGSLFLVNGIRHLTGKRLVRSSFFGMAGVCLISLAGLAFMVGLNLLTYHRLTYEHPILKIHFREISPEQYEATLTDTGSGASKRYNLAGNEWQLDARVLRWPPWLQIAGFNSGYRLERLSGRYNTVEDELHKSRSVYDLARNQGLDIWSLTRRYAKWLNWADAYYGSATYLPMNNNADYEVSISQYGLIARPANASANESVSTWQ